MSKVNQTIVTFRSVLMSSLSLLADVEAAIELYTSHKVYDIRMNILPNLTRLSRSPMCGCLIGKWLTVRRALRETCAKIVSARKDLVVSQPSL